VTTTEQVQGPRQASIFEMYRALVGVGIFCGLLIVTVFEVTKPIIAENRARALQEAVFNVLERAESSTTFRYTNDGTFEKVTSDRAEGALVYAGYDEGGSLVGVALEAQSMGYADIITVLYGYSFEKDAIVGFKVLESKETPGLGDKIETDEDFLRNFESLDVSLTDDGDELEHPIESVKGGEKEHPWQIDAITGATISSVAVTHALRDSAAKWVPVLDANRSAFVREEPSDG